MSYTIKLEKGKYLIVNDNGSLTILRNGDPWPAAEDLKHVGVVLALAQRVEELETTIKAVLDGSLIVGDVRNDDGITHVMAAESTRLRGWEDTLRKVLDAAA